MSSLFSNLKILLLILVLCILSGCDSSTIKLDWVCFNGPNKLDCNYSLFTGQETKEIFLNKSEILEVDFEGEVDSGLLILEIEDPQGQIIWKTENTDQYIGCRTIPVFLTGRYHLIAIGQDTKGSFQIEWQNVN